MRKGFKLKASFIFLAWSVVFMHNIIPHNHQADECLGCHELIHNTNPTEDDCSGPLKYKPEPQDVNVCHISNFLYHQFSDDTIIHQASALAEYCISGLTVNIIPDSEKSFIRNDHCGAISFRAPPLA